MSRPASVVEQRRVCVVCGREIEWRKKWARDWEHVKYCSDACRGRRQDTTRDPLQQAMIELLRQRTAGATICPSEVARLVAGAGGAAEGLPGPCGNGSVRRRSSGRCGAPEIRRPGGAVPVLVPRADAERRREDGRAQSPPRQHAGPRGDRVGLRRTPVGGAAEPALRARPRRRRPGRYWERGAADRPGHPGAARDAYQPPAGAEGWL